MVFVSNFLSYRLKLQVLFKTAVKRKLQDLAVPVLSAAYESFRMCSTL